MTLKERLLNYDRTTAAHDMVEAVYRIEALEAALRERTKMLVHLKARIDTRINDLLCETKPNYDDSIVGINDAWDVVRKTCDEYIARAALAPEATDG